MEGSAAIAACADVAAAGPIAIARSICPAEQALLPRLLLPDAATEGREEEEARRGASRRPSREAGEAAAREVPLAVAARAAAVEPALDWRWGWGGFSWRLW